jgi:hypothetical protein
MIGVKIGVLRSLFSSLIRAEGLRLKALAFYSIFLLILNSGGLDILLRPPLEIFSLAEEEAFDLDLFSYSSFKT